MFANTLTLTVNSVAKVLTRINQDNYGSEYQLVLATERYNLKFRHQKQKAKTPNGSIAVPFDSHNAFVEHVVFKTATAPEVVRTASVTVRVQLGDDTAQADHLSDALGVLAAAQMSGLVQGES